MAFFVETRPLRMVSRAFGLQLWFVSRIESADALKSIAVSLTVPPA